jgi:hypothetical protein
MLTAMRWDDLSIWTTISARTGVPVMIATPANTRLASRPPDSHFMIAAPATQFSLSHDGFSKRELYRSVHGSGFGYKLAQ